MKTGLYNKTRALLIIIALIAVISLAFTAGIVAPQQQIAVMKTQDIATTVADVPTKELTISNIQLFGIVEGAKIYDGKSDIVVTNSEKSGIVVGDDVRVSAITCTAASVGVGEDIALTYAATLAGRDAGQYSIKIESAINTINITPAPITLKNVVATDRIYDGTTVVALSGGELQGIIGRDDVGFTLDSTGTIVNKNSGSKAVTYAVPQLTGLAAFNYELVSIGDVNVTINKAPLSAVWGVLKFEYNKTRHLPTVTVEGALDGESVSAIAQYNNDTDGVDVVTGGGYNIGLKLEGNDKDNYSVLNARATVVITPTEATIEWGGDNIFIAHVRLSNITATVTNAISGDLVEAVLMQERENKPGRFVAQVVGLNNANYTLPATVYTKEYIVRSATVSNYATTALKLSIDIIDDINGFDPKSVFYVEKIDNTKALFGKLKKEEKPYASYKVRMAIDNVPMELNQKYKYSLSVPATNKSDAKYIKVALYDGATTTVMDLEIVDGKVTFEATNLLEISVVIAYAPIFVWLWAVLGILAFAAVIVAIWLLLFRLGKRKLLFDPSGGEPVEGIAGKFHQDIALPPTTRAAHLFNGWFANKSLKTEVKADKMPFWDTVLVAKWLDADGVPVPYTAGSTILPAARDAIIAAKLDNTIEEQNASVVRTITIDTRGGLDIPAIKAVKGAKVELPIPNKASDAFVGWYLDTEFKSEALIGVMPKKSITIYAKWASDRNVQAATPLTIQVDKSDKTRTLTFDSRGGGNIESITAVKKAKIKVPEPTKFGDTFAYWSADGKIFTKKIDLSKMPTEDMKVYAVYACDLNPSGVAITEEAKRNEALNEPIEKKAFAPQEFNRIKGVPSAVDDKIDALMFGKAVMPSSRPLVDQARQETAKQQPIESIRQTVEVTKKAIIEPVSATEEKQTLQEKLLVKAIMFNTRGGNGLKPLQVKMGTPIELPTPIKGESKFLGWYKDESLLKQCDFNKMPSKNTMLFAKWIEDATVQELFDTGMADAVNNQAFDDDQARIDRMFAPEEKGMDDIVIQRTSTKKSSLLIDDSKKKKDN